MATEKKSTRKSTKPRTKRGRRPRIKIVVAQPIKSAAADSPQAAELVKVTSAVVRRRQKARSAGEAAPKVVRKPAATSSKDASTATPQAKRGRKLSATTQFILSQPGDVPAADVVKAAAEKGIELTETLVHKVRSRYRGRTATGQANAQATSAAASTTSATTRAGGKKYRSASEFVREQPIDMPAREVVDKAKKLGIKLSQSLVRVTRFKMRHGGEAKPAAAGRGTVRRGRPPKATVAAGKAARRGRPPKMAPALAGGLSAAEVQFRRLVIELGTGRAKALVGEVEKGLEALIKG